MTKGVHEEYKEQQMQAYFMGQYECVVYYMATTRLI